jgi:uncharacterized protein (TIGR00251 family)
MEGVAIKVLPRSSRNQVLGLRDGAVAIKLQAPPVEGAANAALISYLAALLGVAKRDVCLLRGDASRQKLISVAGFNAPALRAELLRHGSAAAAADPD